MPSRPQRAIERPPPDFVIQAIPRPMDEDPESGWNKRVYFFGPTAFLNELCIHAGVLSGHMNPHPPHTHEHEELHISLSDNLELVGCEAGSGKETARPIGFGSVFFTDSGIPHTVRNTASQPAAYLHCRWKKTSGPTRPEREGPHFCYSPIPEDPMGGKPVREGLAEYELFSGPTRHLTRLRALSLRLQAGGIIPLHRHPHEVIFVLVSGSVEVLGRKLDAPGFAFMGTRMPHQVVNLGPDPAHLYAFELHQEE